MSEQKPSDRELTDEELALVAELHKNNDDPDLQALKRFHTTKEELYDILYAAVQGLVPSKADLSADIDTKVEEVNRTFLGAINLIENPEERLEYAGSLIYGSAVNMRGFVYRFTPTLHVSIPSAESINETLRDDAKDTPPERRDIVLVEHLENVHRSGIHEVLTANSTVALPQPHSPSSRDDTEQSADEAEEKLDELEQFNEYKQSLYTLIGVSIERVFDLSGRAVGPINQWITFVAEGFVAAVNTVDGKDARTEFAGQLYHDSLVELKELCDKYDFSEKFAVKDVEDCVTYIREFLDKKDEKIAPQALNRIMITTYTDIIQRLMIDRHNQG